MELTKPIYHIINAAIKLNKAEIIEDNDYLLINDKSASIFYIVNYLKDDLEEVIRNAKKYQDTVCIVSEKSLNLNLIPPFEHFIDVRQFTYYGNKYDINVPYRIEKVNLSNLDYLKNHYMRIGDDDSYLVNAINRGMLKAVSTDGNIMGFIGEHPEHAMGMLFIDEQYRRQGIGSALEKSLINKYIDEGKVPFGHIARDNIKSLNLQASLGLEEDQGYIYWYF